MAAGASASSFETTASRSPQDEAQLHPSPLKCCRILIPHPEGPPQAGVSKDGRSRASSHMFLHVRESRTRRRVNRKTASDIAGGGSRKSGQGIIAKRYSLHAKTP